MRGCGAAGIFGVGWGWGSVWVEGFGMEELCWGSGGFAEQVV